MHSGMALLADDISRTGLFQECRAALRQAGVDHSEWEAWWIIQAVLEVDRATFMSSTDGPVPSEQTARIRALIQRRAGREPLQYVLGTQEFCGLDMAVSPAVLIPRPETEGLVEQACRVMSNATDGLLVEVGTGSGCISVALATRLPYTRIFAIDLSNDALAVATANAVRCGVAGRIQFLVGDLLTPLPALEDVVGKVDVVVSNPPYIPNSEIADLQPEVRWEPRLALAGGVDGLGIIRRLIAESGAVLRPLGWLMMEVGQGQANVVSAFARAQGDWAHVEVVQDGAGIDRILCLQRKGK